MVEWITGMDYWNGLARMRIRAIRLACPCCPAQARESSCCIPCNHPSNAAMAMRGSETAGSPIRLDDSPAGKNRSELPLGVAVSESASPVKVLQGDQFR